MNKPYCLVVFDWEGTLGDTVGQIFKSLVIEAKKLKFGEINLEEAKKTVELGLVKALKKLFGDLDEAQQEELLEAVQRSVITRSSEVCLIPGAKEFIEQLHQAKIQLAIASNKSQLALQRAIHHAGLVNFFTITYSADQAPVKPSPQMLRNILDICHVAEKDALVLGDSIIDIQMAKSLHVDAIGVDFYHQNTAALLTEGALAVFDDYKKLADYLKLPIIGQD